MNDRLELRQQFIYYHLPLILWAAMILTVSSIPSNYIPKVDIFEIDKLVHIAVFCIFGLLFFRSYNIRNNYNSASSKIYIITILTVIFFGIFTELYQSLIPGRRTDVFDLIANIIGGFFALIIARIIDRLSK